MFAKMELTVFALSPKTPPSPTSTNQCLFCYTSYATHRLFQESYEDDISHGTVEVTSTIVWFGFDCKSPCKPVSPWISDR